MSLDNASWLISLLSIGRLLHGGPLLTSLHSLCDTGSKLTDEVAWEVLDCALQPTIRGIHMWLVHGRLKEGDSGFFVKEQADVPEADYWAEAFV